MGNEQVRSFSDRVSLLKRKVFTKVKDSLVNDVPPGAKLADSGRAAPSIEQIRELSERYSLASLLPYESYDDETGLYFNKDTVGFMLYANPSAGLSTQTLRTLNGFFNQNHKADATIQISLVADPNIEPLMRQWVKTKTHAPDKLINDVCSMLAINRMEYMSGGKWESLFNDQAFLMRNFHLVISYAIPTPRGTASVDMPEDDLAFLRRMREQVQGTLASSGMGSQPMPPDLFLNIMNGLLNPSREAQPGLHYDDENLLSSQMIDGDTMAMFDSGVSTIVHKGKNFSVMPFHVRQFPTAWAGFNNGDLIGSFTNNILRIPCPFIATLTVAAPDQVSAKGMAKRKFVRATQMADSPVSKIVPQWKDRRNDWNFVSKKVDEGNKLLQAFYQIQLIMPEGKEQECEQALQAVYGANGWILSRSRYTPVHTFLGALPMGLCRETKRALEVFGHYATRLSWNCTNIAPWIGEWKGTQTPMMMFTGRRGQVTLFDPFDNNKGNFNISCAATSGSGKSFFTQEWVFSCLGYGGRAFIIDAGHSYKNLCRLLNGTYLEFGAGLDIRLNPFSTIDDSDPEFFREQLPLLKRLIAQMASPNSPLTSKQSAVLEEAIMDAWEQKRAQASITTVVDVLKSRERSLGAHNTADDLATMLFSYTKRGSYGQYFEGESNIDLDHPFVVLELDALNQMPDLQSVVLLILMMRITQAMYLSGNKGQRKLCIIDEAWRLLGRGAAGEFIGEGYRVARKHGGSFMTITQKISDYFTSETAQAAFANSDFKIYLRQDPAALAKSEADKQIDNSAGLVDTLRSLETVQGKYSELAINSPDGTAVARFAVDPVTEKIYSTKADEVEFIRKREAEGVGIFDAVKELLEQQGNRR